MFFEFRWISTPIQTIITDSYCISEINNYFTRSYESTSAEFTTSTIFKRAQHASTLGREYYLLKVLVCACKGSMSDDEFDHALSTVLYEPKSKIQLAIM